MKALLSLMIISFATTGLFAQDEKSNPIENAINAKEYSFKARTMMPATGSVRQLTSSYDFTINHDSAISYLPYFGRAYVAPIGKSENALDFTSTKFSYKATKGKKGGWTIEIRPKDAGDIELVSINVSKNGYGTLYVTSRNRQGISYSGKIEPLKSKT